MKKTILYLDMDGTIANLYGLDNWLERLLNEDKTVFIDCEPLITEKQLLTLYPLEKYDIRILSMTPKNATQAYCESVREQKNVWLDKYFPRLQKRLYMAYGYNKNLKNSKNAMLIDDNDKIRANYKGIALYPEWL